MVHLERSAQFVMRGGTGAAADNITNNAMAHAVVAHGGAWPWRVGTHGGDSACDVGTRGNDVPHGSYHHI